MITWSGGVIGKICVKLMWFLGLRLFQFFKIDYDDQGTIVSILFYNGKSWKDGIIDQKIV